MTVVTRVGSRRFMIDMWSGRFVVLMHHAVLLNVGVSHLEYGHAFIFQLLKDPDAVYIQFGPR